MARRFNRRQCRENERFLAALANTGNVRLVALVLGVNRSTYTKRRARCPDFAARWDAALAAARAALAAEAEGQGPGPTRGGDRRRPAAASPHAAAPAARPAAAAARPAGAVPGTTLVRRLDGTVQLRRARPHQIGPADELAYLRALEEVPNKRRAAARAGFAHTSFERRVRRSPGFAGRVELALAAGWFRVLGALHQSFERLAGPCGPDDEEEWEARIDDCPLPPMSVEDALLLLRYHEGAVHRRRR